MGIDAGAGGHDGMRGALRFARYALAPNRLGYCGPDDDRALFEHAVALSGPTMASTAGVAPAAAAVERAELLGGLRALAAGFEGAWPYLELIAASNGIEDPLDDRVVRAYWLGGGLVRRVGPAAVGAHVEDRFRRRAGRWWGEVATALASGAHPSHAFHVLVVGPWVGLLRGGVVDAPVEVIDRCRIRVGRVMELDGDAAVVSTDRIVFRSGRLERRSGDPTAVERVRLGEGGRHPCGPVRVGDTVAVHWDWVCEVLHQRGAAAVEHAETAALALANRALAEPGAAELG